MWVVKIKLSTTFFANFITKKSIENFFQDFSGFFIFYVLFYFCTCQIFDTKKKPQIGNKIVLVSLLSYEQL